MSTTGWLQCLAGASGDMVLGAVVDAGVPLDVLQDAVDGVKVERVELASEVVERGGVSATKVHVKAPHTTVVRTWGNVRGLLEDADLHDDVRARALDVFARLARAEATAHRTSPEQVHFHEVGALDAIADVVGSAAGLHHLGVTTIACTPVAVGSGMVRSEHGLLPVPGPAVVALLSEAGAPTYSGDAPYELCTPTGAALIASTVTSWGGQPPMRVETSGFGAGSRDLDEVPNVLRLVVGQPTEATPVVMHEGPGSQGTAVVLETNVDDLDPRLWPSVLARLLKAGASDAWLTPILMKKGRPAHTLSVLVAVDKADIIRRAVFVETSAIGLRETTVGKHALERQLVTVTVGECAIRVKVARLDGAVVNAQPEYDDVVAAADALGRPIKGVLAAAVSAAEQALFDGE